MPNNNLPPGWGNRALSAKPDWENPHKELVRQENEVAQDSDVSKDIDISPTPKEEVQENTKVEFTNNSFPVSDSKKVKKESIEETSVSEHSAVTVQRTILEYTEEKPKKSKIPVIILSMLLVIVIITLGVFAVLYFTKDKPDDNMDSAQDSALITITETTSDETIASTTITTTPTTTTATTAATTTTTTESYADISSYIGFWHKESVGYDRELTISSVKRNTIIFSLWYYRIDSIEDIPATLENDTAYFDTGDVQGYLTFEDDIITVVITNSSRAFMTPELMTFDGRHDHSWEYEGFDTTADFESYIIQVTNPKLSIYDSPSYSANIVGEITDKSRYTIVEEYVEPGQTSIGYIWGKLKSGVGWINMYDATIVDDSFYAEEAPNVWCPNCSYGFFTTGVGIEGFTCPSCGHNWLP